MGIEFERNKYLLVSQVHTMVLEIRVNVDVQVFRVLKVTELLLASEARA
jgi:hypothetical protein